MAKSDKSMIDLGKTPSETNEAVMSSDSKKTYYPSFFVRDVKGLDALPKGEFSFTGKGKLVSYTENLRDGTCTCEIEIHGIKPEGSKAVDTETSLGDKLDEIAEDKADEEAYDEEAD